MTVRPPRPPRAEPPDIAALRDLQVSRPELAEAAALQLALVEMHRRVQARVPLPWIAADETWLRTQLSAGRPLVRFADIPIEWSDFRLTFRQAADILRRHEALAPDAHDAVIALGREGGTFERLVAQWYARSSERGATAVDEPGVGELDDDARAGLEQVLALALRPFLSRAAEALAVRLDMSAWDRGHCPYCGGEADFSVITPGAERRLICGRCTAQWAFPAIACPFCPNRDRARLTSFATPDGHYRVTACDACRRYIKAYDARGASRPLLLSLDVIATLPLDAAAMQRGYAG